MTYFEEELININKKNNQNDLLNQMVELMAKRRSIRLFDETKTIPDQVLNNILETMRLAPSSYGLFNVRILVLPRSKVREELAPIFFNQKNFITASHYVIFLVDNGKRIKNHTIYETATGIFGEKNSVQKTNFINNFITAYKNNFSNATQKTNDWSARQAYIAGGIATITAATHNIGTCMMEGFDNQKLYEFLLKKSLIKDYQLPVLGLALGYPDLDYEFKPKARLSYEEYVTIVDK